MNKSVKTKEDIFEQTIMRNIRRKSKYIDNVQMYENIPLFSWIDVNITELCNRKCGFCPRKDPGVYPNQNLNMDVKLADKIAKELSLYSYTGGVVFSGNSEPLLHPDIIDIIASFGRDAHTELVTNGDKLNKDLLRELFNAGLGFILISMYDGPHQVDYFKNMLEEAGLKEKQYFLRDRWYSVKEDYGLKLTNRAGSMDNIRKAGTALDRPCYYLDYSMQIDWNGDVLLCVQDFNKKIKFGNIYADSLLNIWRSQNMAKYRKALGKGNREFYPCNSCDVNGTLHGYNHVKLWNKVYGG